MAGSADSTADARADAVLALLQLFLAADEQLFPALVCVPPSTKITGWSRCVELSSVKLVVALSLQHRLMGGSSRGDKVTKALENKAKP